jgi:iron complex transport system ATP-binding protein
LAGRIVVTGASTLSRKTLIMVQPGGAASETLFETRELRFGYVPGRWVLDGLDFFLPRGAFLGVLGPNGAGKSTLLHLLTGWMRPNSGTVRFRGRDVAQWNRRAFAREVAVVPQSEERVFPCTAEEVVLMGRYAHQPVLAGFDDEEDHTIARNVLERVGLGGFAHRRMNQLSGGEMQRVLLARALAQCPTVLLLDEPTANLDLGYQRETFRLLEDLNRQGEGITVLAISHDINLAALYCRRLALLHGGKLLAEGTPAELLTEERLSAVYRTAVRVRRDEDGQPHVSVVR